MTSSRSVEPGRALSFVERRWDDEIVPTLTEYIQIPAKSPMFDPRWREHGHLDRAVALIERWSRARAIDGLSVEVVRLPGRTPVVLMEAPGPTDTVLLYGHLDKQPEMSGWADGLGPWIPVRRGDRLYGRGSADDGYAAFAALTAIEALRHQAIPHARCVVLIEACEESGSYDLPAYVDALADRIGTPSLIIGLDSGCATYDQLWATTSLRGVVNGLLTVTVLTEGLHSGAASGVVPSSFRIARSLLSRLEDERWGTILPRDFHVEIPPNRVEEARAAAPLLVREALARLPLVDGMRLLIDDPVELVLNRTWRPALSITGAAGLPSPEDAGNVLRPTTTLKLSLRLPPTVDAERATQRLKALLEADPPYGAHVSFTPESPGAGWDAPPMSDWLLASIHDASATYFGQPAMFMGEGGSIPFMKLLGDRFPRAEFLITGVLGPESNAHGPNEFLHLPTGARVTACIARILADHFLSHATPR